MSSLLNILMPEIILAVAAGVLILMGVSRRLSMRQAAPVVAILALLAVFYLLIFAETPTATQADPTNSVRLFHFANYIKILTAGIGMLLVLLAWPTRADATGNAALDLGHDGGEFFGLMLLSLAGVFLVASANDIILLFLGIELASIPTYIMVSLSRPLPEAQEAGVKYFFLGALSAALMLFGFSYLYGTTGLIHLDAIMGQLRSAGGTATTLTSWQMLAALMILAGFVFKMAAVPLHFYAPDVYQGAATPLTALLSFVPKISGLAALLKLMFALSGGLWTLPHPLPKLLWIIAVLTMFVGNTLGLLQFNVKRVLAYSSIAHSGYMLTAVAVLAGAGSVAYSTDALTAVLFYIAIYGIANVGAFAVLTMLPGREDKPATSAETFEDLAGTGRRHPGLGLVMAVSCFSLIGIPLTAGFVGKLYLIRPALDGGFYWLVILTVINAAISAGYYLRIVGAMFLRDEPAGSTAEGGCATVCGKTIPLVLAAIFSVGGTILLGAVFPAIDLLTTSTVQATALEDRIAPMNVAE